MLPLHVASLLQLPYLYIVLAFFAVYISSYLMQVAQEKIKEQSPTFVISEDSVCAACNRRLGTR